MLPPAPPPLSRLEKLVLEHTDFDIQVSFEAQCENVRRWLRAEIEKRLREHARPKTIAVPCGGCGSPVDITAGYAVQVSGQHPLGRGVELVCRVGFPVPAGVEPHRRTGPLSHSIQESAPCGFGGTASR